MLFGATEFAITDTKLYVPFATLSTQNKAKLLETADIKLSKTQLRKRAQWGGFQGRPLEPLLKTGLPLKRNALNKN